MGWESRGDSSRKYYTRSRKRFGRVEREYVGCGPLALLEDNLDDLHRRELAEARKLKRDVESRDLTAYCEWRDSMGELSNIELAIFESLGFHKHRGQFRLRRMNTQLTKSIWDAVRRANLGDEDALAQVREELLGPNR